jgi:hypothetical protein
MSQHTFQGPCGEVIAHKADRKDYCGHKPLTPIVDDVIAMIDAALADVAEFQEAAEAE